MGGKKIARRSEDSLAVTTAHIMFKYLYYEKDNRKIHFGSNGANWKSKDEIARELQLYKPWSIDHAIKVIGKANLNAHMMSIIEKSNSPTEVRLFENWKNLSPNTDRPMLFPQVGGHSNGIFYCPYQGGLKPSPFRRRLQ